jgi:hypothetical protein
LLAPVVLTILLDKLDGGILKHERLLILMHRPRFLIIILLAIGMFEHITVGGFKRRICVNFKVHAGSVGFIDGKERFVLVFVVGVTVEIYHGN